MGKYEKMNATGKRMEVVNVKLLKAAIRFNSLMLGLTGGTLAAVVIYFATYVSLAKWGDGAGNYLGLLAVFFPGYTVSNTGAFIGAAWAFVYAGTFCSLGYRMYGSLLGARLVSDGLGQQVSDNPVLKPSILRLHGLSLGLAIGCMSALLLFLSTAWLVVRGTAAESVHAALLANYIPGYSVSIPGALLGAVFLFIFAFLGCTILAAVYNKIVTARYG